MLIASSAWATHFRYGHLTWVPRPDIDPNAVDFTLQTVWRRSAYRTGNGRCIDPVSLVAAEKVILTVDAVEKIQEWLG